MESIILPSKIDVEELAKHRTRFVLEPCYPGYGTTLGNALRRVLLSSLPGAAATSVRIEGVDHEFSTVQNVKEDVVGIILNLKLLRFVVHSDNPVHLRLDVKGERTVTGFDFDTSSDAEVINTKQTIATLTDKAAHLILEIVVAKGRGYVPVENREKEKFDVGWIALDSVYTPIKTVNYTVENVRVGQITNYDKLVLDVESDGTIRPVDALVMSAQILVDHFSSLTQLQSQKDADEGKKKKSRAKKPVLEASPDEPSTPTTELEQVIGPTNASSAEA